MEKVIIFLAFYTFEMEKGGKGHYGHPRIVNILTPTVVLYTVSSQTVVCGECEGHGKPMGCDGEHLYSKLLAGR